MTINIYKVADHPVFLRLPACSSVPPEETSFRELIPAQVDDYSHLRLFERAAQLFSRFVGARGGVKMGSTAFRTFTRLVLEHLKSIYLLTCD